MVFLAGLLLSLCLLYFETIAGCSVLLQLLLGQMQESFSRGSVSCLINTNLGADQDLAEDQKSDPCWQVTQQLHHHIEKVSDSLLPPRVCRIDPVKQKKKLDNLFSLSCRTHLRPWLTDSRRRSLAL